VIAGLAALWLACAPAPGERAAAARDPLAALPKGEAEALRIAVIPISGGLTDEAIHPLEEYLEGALGVPVHAAAVGSYGALAERLSGAANDPGAADVGVFSPLAYVDARAEQALIPLATATSYGAPTYTGYLITREAPDAAETLEGLAGARVAWVHRLSTSGYLYPRALLRHRGLEPDALFAAQSFAGDHVAALTAVVDGAADAAAVSSSYLRAGRDLPGVDPDTLRVIGKTERIPYDVVVARPGLPRGTAEALRAALLALNRHPAYSEPLTERWGFGGFVAFDATPYARIEELLDAERRASR